MQWKDKPELRPGGLFVQDTKKSPGRMELLHKDNVSNGDGSGSDMSSLEILYETA